MNSRVLMEDITSVKQVQNVLQGDIVVTLTAAILMPYPVHKQHANKANLY